MKKYGRQKQHPGNLPDNHPPKRFRNWWEIEYHNGKSKKRECRQAAIDIIKELIEKSSLITNFDSIITL